MTGITPKVKSGLGSAVSEAFGSMAFIDLMPAVKDDDLSTPCRWARLKVKKPVEGIFTIIIEESLMEQVVNSVFGGDKAEDMQKASQDTISELLNTIAGSFLRLYLPGNRAFELGLPENGSGRVDISVLATSLTFNGGPGKLRVAIEGKF